MTADDPRPAGEAAAKACSCNPLSHERGDRCSCYCHQPRPAASGGATDGEREEWRWHREPGTGDEWEQVWTCCGGPYDEAPHGHYADCPAPVASQAEEGLRETARGWILRHSSQPGGDRWGYDPDHLDWAAQNLLIDLAPWLADAAKVQRVRELADRLDRGGLLLRGELRRALDEQP